ncbi:unnamed protein product [Anisakis simplex]|uniref:Uncharacterized protein n=1 Tax=Anisakis simplex TaxID=6269 RepID=A0A0M3JEX7_ANISI|nr:unnamed protein product [Anisakis simplex]
MRRYSSSSTSDSRIREPLSEDELRSRTVVTPDDVLRLNKITNGACSLVVVVVQMDHVVGD